MMTHLEFTWSFSRQKGKPLSRGKKGIKWARISMSTTLLWLLCCYFCFFVVVVGMRLLHGNCSWFGWYATYPGTCAFITISDRKQSLNINLDQGKHTFVLPFLFLSWFSFWPLCPFGLAFTPNESGKSAIFPP